MRIAADLCVYTNHEHMCEVLEYPYEGLVETIKKEGSGAM